MVMGNKTDLEKERQVNPEEGAFFASDNDYNFIESSCLTNTNVGSAFETLIEMTNVEAKKKKKNNGVDLNENNKKKGGCC
jgi:hypothetical protein